jgi:hypothetical protein
MCDSIEGVRPVSVNSTHAGTSTIGDKIPSSVNANITDASNVPADGVGLEKALANFALYYKYEELPGCECSTGMIGSGC